MNPTLWSSLLTVFLFALSGCNYKSTSGDGGTDAADTHDLTDEFRDDGGEAGDEGDTAGDASDVDEAEELGCLPDDVVDGDDDLPDLDLDSEDAPDGADGVDTPAEAPDAPEGGEPADDIVDVAPDEITDEDVEGPPCPECMILVDGRFCIDLFEASRPDASAGSQGSMSEYACCVEGVMPWYSSSLTGEEAQAACEAADKRLCTGGEWQYACSNGYTTVYPYGDGYDPLICNGIDTFCYCDSEECAGIEPCPYPHCYRQDPEGNPGGCGAAWHVWATATNIESSPECVTELGIYDISGNIWEATVDPDDGEYWFRGGACNCINSLALHQCDAAYSGGSVNRKGFRCCQDPVF